MPPRDHNKVYFGPVNAGRYGTPRQVANQIIAADKASRARPLARLLRKVGIGKKIDYSRSIKSLR